MKTKKNPTFPWLEHLLSYFLKIKELDDEIEKTRVSLCDISQFSPLSFFEYLDLDSKSFLTLNDFISFLCSQNTTYDELKIRKMIHNFDKDNDFSLNLDEFLGLILPKKNSDLQKNMLSIVNSYSQGNNTVTQDMKSNFNELIIREMKLIKDLDEISSKIKNSKIFSTYEAFLEIVGDDKYMTKFNLYNFLKNNEIFIIDNEVAQLMFRLDADNDDRISYEEFKEIFYPIEEDFVYLPKNEAYNKYKYNYNENKYNKYEINKNYDYSNNNYENDNNYIDHNNDKDYEHNEYESSNTNYNNYNDKDYVHNEYDDSNNNYNNYSDDYKNNDYDKKEKDNVNDNSNDQKLDENSDKKEKKEKKTKKVILRPGLSRNNNPDSNQNLLYSQDQKKNDLMNNPQETSYPKFPNINNNKEILQIIILYIKIKYLNTIIIHFLIIIKLKSHLIMKIVIIMKIKAIQKLHKKA